MKFHLYEILQEAKVTGSKPQPGPQGWWAIDWKGCGEHSGRYTVFWKWLQLLECIHLSELIEMYSEMGALLLYTNYTSIRLSFKKGQKKRKQKRREDRKRRQQGHDIHIKDNKSSKLFFRIFIPRNFAIFICSYIHQTISSLRGQPCYIPLCSQQANGTWTELVLNEI